VIRLSPRHLVAIAGTLVGIGAQPAHHAPGGYIDRLHGVQVSGAASGGAASGGPSLRSLRLCSGQDDRPESWDVAFIQHCGYLSHYDYVCERSAWPMPHAATAAELAAFGAERRALHEQPEAGDIFLQWAFHRATFVHAGIVVAVVARGGRGSASPYYDVDTIEGDTYADGHLGGGMTIRMTRRLSAATGDRFLRWTALESDERHARSMDEEADRSA
jgi:hypothetical protein